MAAAAAVVDGRDERFPSPFNKQGSMVSLVVSPPGFRVLGLKINLAGCRQVVAEVVSNSSNKLQSNHKPALFSGPAQYTLLNYS